MGCRGWRPRIPVRVQPDQSRSKNPWRKETTPCTRPNSNGRHRLCTGAKEFPRWPIVGGGLSLGGCSRSSILEPGKDPGEAFFRGELLGVVGEFQLPSLFSEVATPVTSRVGNPSGFLKKKSVFVFIEYFMVAAWGKWINKKTGDSGGRSTWLYVGGSSL